MGRTPVYLSQRLMCGPFGWDRRDGVDSIREADMDGRPLVSGRQGRDSTQARLTFMATTSAEFEEKEYEGAANGELAAGGFIMSAGQVIEKIVGYDAIAAPVASHVVWQLLRVPRPPGIRLLPRFWYPGETPSAARLPEQPVSLVLQYKRPQYLHGPRAAQWSYWHQPYYRFTRRDFQHKVLRRLERALGSAAVVRYASPAFWRYAELEAAAVTHQVLRLTGFVPPLAMGSHRVWTYVQPGIGGRANPTARHVPFETTDQLFASWGTPPDSSLSVRAGALPDRLGIHLGVIAQAARSQEPLLRHKVAEWVRRVRSRELLLSDTGLQQLAYVATITSLMDRIGATWHIADRSRPFTR